MNKKEVRSTKGILFPTVGLNEPDPFLDADEVLRQHGIDPHKYGEKIGKFAARIIQEMESGQSN